MHLWHWHVWDTMVILQEGNLPHPQCSLCNMLVTWRYLNGSHKHTSQCMTGGGAESMELGGRGGKGGKIKGVQHLWEHPSDGTALQLPG